MNKKNIYKIIFCCVSLSIILTFGLFYFIKCKTSENLIQEIEIGMSINEVESILAYPKKMIDDNATISENSYDEYRQLHSMNSILPDEEIQLRMEQLNQVYTASENGGHVKEYIYQTSKRDVQIYFVGGSVYYVNKVNED